MLWESVAQRTHEIGIRLALDADPRDLMKLILGQALKLTGIGLVIARPCAVAISRAMAHLIFGVVSVDLAILGGFTALPKDEFHQAARVGPFPGPEKIRHLVRPAW